MCAHAVQAVPPQQVEDQPKLKRQKLKENDYMPSLKGGDYLDRTTQQLHKVHCLVIWDSRPVRPDFYKLYHRIIQLGY